MRSKMVLKNFMLVVFCATMAQAQQVLSAGDMLDEIKSALGLDFRQEDALKPIVQKYADTAEQMVALSPDGRLPGTQVKDLNQQLDGQLKAILTPQQMEAWQQARKSLELAAGPEGRERGESGEMNEKNEASEAGER